MDMNHITKKMSHLTLGSGKVTQHDSIDRLELHLDKGDYSNLITQRLRPTDNFSVIRKGQSNFTPIPTKLPKTFVTKSGALFLYSDSKVMKDNAKVFPAAVAPRSFCVKGFKVTSPAGRENVSHWKRFTLPKRNKLHAQNLQGSEKRRDDIMYIRGLRGTSYSWNYAITSDRKPKARPDVTKETIKGLSNALLGYHTKNIALRLRYENRIMNVVTGSLNSAVLGKSKSSEDGKQKLSSWTLDWLNSIGHSGTEAGNAEANGKTQSFENKYQLLQNARTELILSGRIGSRPPTNTPSTANDRGGLKSPA